jgi:Mg2+ and Co2+ transporter CorA
MSATSVCCLQTYRDVVGDKLNDTIETNIKTIYSFISQAEQLSAQLAPIYELQKKIIYIKQLLEILSQSI